VFPALSGLTASRVSLLQDERYRAHRAVRDLLERLSAAKPLVLVLDIDRRTVIEHDRARLLVHATSDLKPPGHRTTLVGRKTGRTVQQWISERRMAEGRRLLVETAPTVEAVGADVGFRDPSYFIKSFSARTRSRRCNGGAAALAWRVSAHPAKRRLGRLVGTIMRELDRRELDSTSVRRRSRLPRAAVRCRLDHRMAALLRPRERTSDRDQDSPQGREQAAAGCRCHNADAVEARGRELRRGGEHERAARRTVSAPTMCVVPAVVGRMKRTVPEPVCDSRSRPAHRHRSVRTPVCHRPTW